MHKRFLSTGMLLLALLASAWGNVLAAAMCPHSAQSSQACCHARAAHHPSSHEGMEAMEMGDVKMEPAAEQATPASAFGQLAGACAHCMSHSQPSTLPATLREAGQSKRGSETATPLIAAETVLRTALLVQKIPAREHAPPGAARFARHVLISVFRI
jgi:hypothetical protein